MWAQLIRGVGAKPGGERLPLKHGEACLGSENPSRTRRATMLSQQPDVGNQASSRGRSFHMGEGPWREQDEGLNTERPS